ncbi:methyltransferase [Nonomuraea sp. NPDC026600]|uniref:methyltransferase n=1 Tax=Nonomuraea sp. NPDC026600 TaxID=3155363 RepID=UPI0033D9DE47
MNDHDHTPTQPLNDRSAPGAVIPLVLDQPRLSPREIVQDMMDAVARFAALAALVQLGVPQVLEARSLSADEVAVRCKADPDAMAHLLSVVHAYGFVNLDGAGGYALTALGGTLLPDAEDSMWAAISVTGSPLWWDAAATLDLTIQQGHPAVFDEVRGGLYGVLADSNLADRFDRFMADRARPVARALAALDYTGVATLVDLGGGNGGILAAIMEANAQVKGVLVERPDVAARAEFHLASRGLGPRCEMIHGDLFTTDCPTGERIILSSVLHNYPDDQAIEILSRAADGLRRAGPGAALWCIEGLLPPPGVYTPVVDRHARMLAMFNGGAERTLLHYRRLMKAVGLELSRNQSLAPDQELMIAHLAA